MNANCKVIFFSHGKLPKPDPVRGSLWLPNIPAFEHQQILIVFEQFSFSFKIENTNFIDNNSMFPPLRSKTSNIFLQNFLDQPPCNAPPGSVAAPPSTKLPKSTTFPICSQEQDQIRLMPGGPLRPRRV